MFQLCLSFSITMAVGTFAAWPRVLRFHPKPIKNVGRRSRKGIKMPGRRRVKGERYTESAHSPFPLIDLMFEKLTVGGYY